MLSWYADQSTAQNILGLSCSCSCVPASVPEPEPEPEPVPEPVVPSNPCVQAGGYFVIPGTRCQQYVYCIRGQVRFQYECEEGKWFAENIFGCSSERPNGC